MNTIITHLQQLGFSEYETKAYIALLQQHPLNGYAIAKASGVPRANIYGVMQKLESHGAVIAVDTTAGKSYSPVSPDDLIRQLGNHISEVLLAARRDLETFTTPVKQTYVQNLRGDSQLLEHARDLINIADNHLLIALWQPQASLLANVLAEAQHRGVAVQTLCCQACLQECGGCQGNIYRYRITPDQEAHWLIIIRDESEMLVGTMDVQATAIRTRQTGLIQMMTWYLRHSIALAAVLKDAGDTLNDALHPETRQLLYTIGQGENWFDYLRHMVETGQEPS
jgi:HTH-type transcriptional regulator, sugar sensing transcriptional regulator